MTRTLTAIFAVVVTAAYLGLAVWGEGSFGAFASHVALVWLAGITLAQGAIAPLTQGSLSTGVREDRGNRWVLAAFGLIGLVDGYLPAWSDRTGFGPWPKRRAGQAWLFTPSAAGYDCGRSWFLDAGSAAWWPSSRATNW